jgi:hypothetical protein
MCLLAEQVRPTQRPGRLNIARLVGFLSPEATNSIAGGNATGKLWHPIRPCKGRILSPEVFWIVVDTILLDEREKLIFKPSFLMVLLLASKVRTQDRNL